MILFESNQTQTITCKYQDDDLPSKIYWSRQACGFLFSPGTTVCVGEILLLLYFWGLLSIKGVQEENNILSVTMALFVFFSLVIGGGGPSQPLILALAFVPFFEE